jgi:hypothetical protein
LLGFGAIITVTMSLTFDHVRNHIQTFSDWLIFQKKVEKDIFDKTVVTLMHELNSPLTVLNMSIQCLEKAKGLEPSSLKLVALIKTSSKKIQHILKKLQNVQIPVEAEYINGIKMVRLDEE